MLSSSAPVKVVRLTQLVAAGAGAVYGLGLARFSFELNPQHFTFFGAWPGAVLLAAVVLAIAEALGHYARRLDQAVFPYAIWAPLALALPIFSIASPDVIPLRSITLLVGAWALVFLFLMDRPNQGKEPVVLTNPHRAAALWGIPSRPRTLFPLFLFFFLFSLYLRTLAPAVGQADTFEFQVGVARLGIAHGSGYPLLMLIGRLFTLLPVGGTLAFRANLTSAFFGALSAVGVERIARRLGTSPLVALLAGLAFGVSPTLWSRAVEIEVFALNAAFVAAILYLCLDLILPAPPAGGVDAPQTPAINLQTRLMLLAFLFGLSLANHLTTLFLGPACLLAALMAITRQRRDTHRKTNGPAITAPVSHRSSLFSVLRPPAFVLLALLLGLSVYLYLPLRWPAVNRGQALTPAGFANVITGNEARGAFQWRLPFQDAGRYTIVWSKIVVEYGWPGLALTLFGTVSLLWPTAAAQRPDAQAVTGKRPGIRIGKFQFPATNSLVLLLLFVTCLGYTYFELAFNVPDPSFSSYIIPLHLIAAVLMALGVQWLLTLGRRPSLNVAESSPAPLALPYPPNLHALAPLQLLSCLLLGAFCLLSLRSIWRTFPLVDRSDNWSAQRFGELMLSQPLAQGAAILADSEKVAPLDYLQIAEGRRPDLDIIVLPDEASYRAALDERLAAGQVVYLGRYLPGLGPAHSLRSVGPLAEVSPNSFVSTTLKVKPALARSVGGISLLGYATSSSQALSGAAPDEFDLTLLWQAQAVPVDDLLVNLRFVDSAGQPAWQSAGSVPVNGLYPTNAWRAGEIVSDFYRLPISPSLAPGAYQLQVALLPPFAPASASAWSAVAPVMILAPTHPSTPPHLLRDQFGPNWLLGYDIPQAVASGSRFPLTLYWWRRPETGAVTAFGETRSLAAWPAGAIVPLVYDLVAPSAGNEIDLTIDAGVPAHCGWLARPAAACPLPAVRLAGQTAAEGAVNFGNEILLNQARLETTSVTPGGSVTVNLEWQAMRSLSVNYTVFVHLLGPDGLVHGQIDRWPVSGTRATSGWGPGERIPDLYNIQLPAGAPPGAYHVEIGLYLLATGERLPVLNSVGVPVDDRLMLAGLQATPP